MASSPMNQVIHQLRSMILRDGVEPSDGQLLECFVTGREEAALEALVRRHGPMVWGVCRRVLANFHDVEDAFQATFLVLVRKASGVKPRELVGNWLYGVAHQTALKARSRSAKRQTREKQVIDMPEPAAPPADLADDLGRLLDQELSRLPDKYRAVLVLCELEGKALKEAAGQLGVPDGTIASRLARGRTMLAKRLSRYNLAVSAAALPALLAQQAAGASVPAATLSATIKAASLLAAGKAAGVVSVQVVALTQEVVKAMFLAKIGKVTAVLLLVIVSCGLGFGAYSSITGGPAEKSVPSAEKKDPSAAAKPQVRPPEEAAKLREQFKANADGFEITIARHGQGDGKVDLRSIMLHSSNRRFEPAVIGPSGQPLFKSARITKEQAIKIIEFLDTEVFFRVAADGNQPLKHKEPYISTLIGYGPDSKPGPRLHLAQDWDWAMMRQLAAVKDCVDGEAAKLVIELLQAISDSQPNPAKQKEKTTQAEKTKLNILKASLLKDEDLPQLPEDIDGLLLRGREGYGTNTVTDEGIKHLTRFKRLRILEAAGLRLTDRSLETIGKLTSLEELSLEINKITGAGLHHLAALKKLRRLDLNYNKLDPAALESLVELPELTSLRINLTFPVDDRLCELCSRLKNLKELQLWENTTAVTDRGLEHLAKLEHLENIYLSGTSPNPNITDAGLAKIARLAHLRKLGLGNLPSVTPEGMKVLGKLTELRSLNIGSVRMDEASLRSLTTLTKLENLLLWGISDRQNPIALDFLGELHSLRTFRTQMPVSSSAIRALARLQNLESITDELFEITDEDLAHLAKLPKLKTLILASDKVTAAGAIPILAKMKSLRELYVTEKVGITPEQWTLLGQSSLTQCRISRFRPPYTVYHPGNE